MSVQRAAAWVLDKYYSEFSIYNPYLDRVSASRHRKGVKMYDIDGQSGINVRTRRIKNLDPILLPPHLLLQRRHCRMLD
jgi:hypothetical protein